MLQDITLKVNHRIHQLRVDPDTPLIYILRNDLGLKGAKFACGLEQCGACKVLIDGQDIPSCRIPVRSVQGREITTLEGLGTAADLHPIQKAFIDEQAVQCGFCVPGLIIAVKALLDRNPHPTEAEIKSEMSGNLCRCGVYDRVLRVIRRLTGAIPDSPSYEKGFNRKPDSSFSSEPEMTDPLAGSLTYFPDIDSWIRVNTDRTISVFTGKVELGQDIRTSVAMIAAEELDVSLERIRVVMADTEQTPNEGYTASSMSLETTGNAIRHAAAEARYLLLSRAAEHLGTPVDRLIVNDGNVSGFDTGRSVSYWDLLGGKKFESKVMGLGHVKSPEDFRLISRSPGRLDLPAKVTGEPCFVQDLDLPGMVHGRVVRPPDYRARLVAVDEEAVRQRPGVLKVVRDGSFLGVIAEREEQAVWAMQALRESATWETEIDLPPREALFEHMLSQNDQAFLVVKGVPVDDPIPPVKAPADAAQTLSATYFRPYHMHASLGPSAAVAQFIDNKITVWSHTQGPYPLRSSLTPVLGMARDDIRVIHMDGPGCYGHNGADDAALDAALLARALPGRPVSLKWMRSDENSWEPYGPATVIKMQGSLSDGGEVVDWNHDVYGYTHMGRPRPRSPEGSSGLLASWHLEKPFKPLPVQPVKAYHVGIHRNADPLYHFNRRRIVKHFLPDSPLRVSALRGLGSYANVFAIESFMDELACAAGIDPLEFRLRHLEDERARAVLRAAADRAGWPSSRSNRDPDRGCGLAFARYKNRQCYVAVFAELSVIRDSGRICLERSVIAADAGQIVNPDAVSNQLEGIFIQAASWTLKEQVAFDRRGIIGTDWHSYPLLRFRDTPHKIETVLLNQPGRPYRGVGEGAQGPVPAAIANAVFNAVNIRLRRIPFTPERVREALEES